MRHCSRVWRSSWCQENPRRFCINLHNFTRGIGGHGTEAGSFSMVGRVGESGDRNFVFFYSATPIETDRCIASPVYAMISSPTITLHRRQWNSQQFNDQLDQPRPTAPVALYANQVGTRMYEIKTSVPLIGNKQASRWRT